MAGFKSGSERSRVNSGPTTLTATPMQDGFGGNVGKGTQAVAKGAVVGLLGMPIAVAIARLTDMARKAGGDATVGDALDKGLEGVENFANQGPASNLLMNAASMGLSSPESRDPKSMGRMRNRTLGRE